MKFIIYYVIPFLGSMFLMLNLFYAMSEIGNKQKQKRWIRRLVVIGYSLVVVVVAFLGIQVLNLILLIIVPLIAKQLYGSEKGDFLYFILMIVAMYLTDVILSLSLEQVFLNQFISGSNIGMLLAVYNLILRLFEYLVIRLIVLLVKKHNGRRITGKQLVTALILPVFCMINLFSCMYFLQVYVSIEMLMVLLLNIILLLAINIYFTYITDTMSENNRLENELARYREQGKIQVRYYEREEEKYEESRKMIHDIRNHITAMEQLYVANNAEQAASYAKNIHSMLNHLNQNYYTSDKLLNIILNDKVTMMRRDQITDDIKIGEVNLDFMKDVDVTTVFANLLDNAVVAAKEDQRLNPYIKLRVNKIRQFISINMENNSKEPKKIGNNYISTKPGHNGDGLKNIERVVQVYDGDMQCEWKDGIFYTTIMLQIP